MVATINGWDDMREDEREALDCWEHDQERQFATCAKPTWWMASRAISIERLMTTHPGAGCR